MKWRTTLVVLLLAGLAMSQQGCGSTAGSQPTSPTTAPAATSTPASAETMTPEVERLVRLAKQDLSQRTGIPESEIRVASVSSETWRDTSLGCPEPGKVYGQVLTPGYRIVLEARGDRYEYHTDAARAVLCQSPA